MQRGPVQRDVAGGTEGHEVPICGIKANKTQTCKSPTKSNCNTFAGRIWLLGTWTLGVGVASGLGKCRLENPTFGDQNHRTKSDFETLVVQNLLHKPHQDLSPSAKPGLDAS